MYVHTAVKEPDACRYVTPVTRSKEEGVNVVKSMSTSVLYQSCQRVAVIMVPWNIYLDLHVGKAQKRERHRSGEHDVLTR